MRRAVSSATVSAAVFVLSLGPAVASAADAEVLRAAPRQVHFGTKQVGTETLRSATITNRSDADVIVLAAQSVMPDDFSFGLLPGSTCPVLEPAVLPAGESCEIVVGFRPSEFFAGRAQTAVIAVTATDPATAEPIESLLVAFQGTGR